MKFMFKRHPCNLVFSFFLISTFYISNRTCRFTILYITESIIHDNICAFHTPSHVMLYYYTFSICKTRDFIKFIENKVDTCEVFHCSGGNMEKPDFSIKEIFENL